MADAGIGGTITSNFTRHNYTQFSGSGSGYQYFEYPSIEITADVEYSPTSATRSGIITATPIVRGGITQIYTYGNGTGYGSTILNFERTPILSVNAGKGCQLKPIITAGKIVNVEIQNRVITILLLQIWKLLVLVVV